jgi:PPOX class probable F420-dependent enzyme
MRTGLEPADLGDLLDLPIVGVLATRRRDDTVLLSPVWHEWRDGGFNLWTGGLDEGKVRHLKRDPRASIVVAESVLPYRGIEVTGEAVLTEDGFRELVERTAARYLGSEQAAAFARAVRPGFVIRLEPGRLRAWDFRDDSGG